jgi:N6-adenosine-specific RNA methylase IME4
MIEALARVLALPRRRETPPLPDGPFAVIYADPAWSYRGREQFGFAGDVGQSTGGAIKQYPTMSVDEIAALDVAEIADPSGALLFLWVPSPLLPDGMRVIDAWGFDFATIAFIWYKQATNPGYYTLSECEICLVAKRGRIPQPRGSRKERQFISELRGEHSAKPAEVRARIERMFPTQTKIELFARGRISGWAAWGLETDARL